MRRKSASRNRPLSRSVNRANFNGRPRGGERRSRSGSIAALLLRLRRCEVVLLQIYGKAEISDTALDILLSNMLDLSKVVEPNASRSDDEGGTAVLPQQGSPPGQASGEADVDGSPDPERHEVQTTWPTRLLRKTPQAPKKDDS